MGCWPNPQIFYHAEPGWIASQTSARTPVVILCRPCLEHASHSTHLSHMLRHGNGLEHDIPGAEPVPPARDCPELQDHGGGDQGPPRRAVHARRHRVRVSAKGCQCMRWLYGLLAGNMYIMGKEGTCGHGVAISGQWARWARNGCICRCICAGSVGYSPEVSVNIMREETNSTGAGWGARAVVCSLTGPLEVT